MNSWVLYPISLFQIKVKYMKELVKLIHQLIDFDTICTCKQDQKSSDAINNLRFKVKVNLSYEAFMF